LPGSITMTNGGRDGKLIGWRYLFLRFWSYLYSVK
jgi:hypothetical protein